MQVAVRPALLMPESERVHDLVDDGGEALASAADRYLPWEEEEKKITELKGCESFYVPLSKLLRIFKNAGASGGYKKPCRGPSVSYT